MPPYDKVIHDFISENQWELAYAMQLKIPHLFENLLDQLVENDV